MERLVQGGRKVAPVIALVLVAGFALGFAAFVAAGEPPVVEITHPDMGATVRGTVTVQGSARDADGEIVKVLVGIDAGEKSLATDTSGNGTWWTWEWTWDTTKHENGWHHVGAVAWDNTEMAGDAAIEVYVDNPLDEPPKVEILSPDGGAVLSGPVEITGIARDDVGVLVVKVRIGLDGDEFTAEDTSGNGTWWTWRLFWDACSVPNGERSIYAKAVDTHEQIGWDVVHIVVFCEGGNHRPWVSIFQPPSGSTVMGIVPVKGHAGDDDPDDAVVLVQVRIEHGEWQNAADASDAGDWSTWAFEWDTSFLEEGWYHVYARSFDGELYSEVDLVEVYVKHEGGDNRRPEVRIDHPESGDVLHFAVLVVGRAWDLDAGDHVAKVQVRIDEGEWHGARDVSGNESWFFWTFVWDTTGYENGGHRVCARAFDGDAYSELDCIEVTVENPDTRPVVHIEHPGHGEEVSGVILIHGTSEDDQRVEKVQVRIDEGDWRTAIDTSSDGSWRTWALEWDTREYENGEHAIFARAWDGHQYSEVHRIVVIVANHDQGFVRVVQENPVLSGALMFAGVAGTSLLLWWRRFGLLGSLR